jgi:ketosteroid isomerase-like protein
MDADNTGVADDLDVIRESFALLRSDTYERSLTLIHDDFEMVTTPEVASEPDVYRGHEGVRHWWESFLEAMDYVELEALSFDDLGDGRVIVEFLIHARGKASGIEAAQPGVTIATVADGKMRSLRFFTSLEAARAAAAAD